MIVDNNLIAFEYDKTQFTPKKIYQSGAKDELTSNSPYFISKNDYALLTLENDIINSEGYGLKKGFYNVTCDKYMDFLYILQSGKIKAKIPVIKTTVIESIQTEQFKVKKLSYNKFIKQQEKEKRKYLDGTNPKEIDYKSAQIQYLDEGNSCILIYNTGIVELVGLIKF